ncbi:hypothetical protein Dacet_2208 [Denitrovibrio acetiphilus DSM 12809]|uniref:Uncharacterized protein n=1 Tax=Denitrovibrio acetiphilus (strain DSM 12809 / NBRC 114555 / N2460) TaxID=522772 RepID=D4H2U7_DENA2|nr:hypothetical protein [Denitrovibrio acetiphilus]ADD68970.1 hypothetical protein Dacet_2208 [Denitrovibrio acetiphilus DSM 12809]
MKAHVLSGSPAQTGRLRMRTLFFASMSLLLLFSVVYVRHLCIKTGYEISSLSDNMERSEISYLSLLDKKSQEYDTENLYKKARELGLSLPDVRRTFYVK